VCETFEQALFEFKVQYSEHDYYEAYREQLELDYWASIILEDDLITSTMDNYFDIKSEMYKQSCALELYYKELLEISFELGHF
jgi:hypothetical protein